MHTFSTNYPRHEHSEGENDSFLFIEKTLSELSVSTRRIQLDTYDSFHSFSSIIAADFTGSAEGEVYLIFPVNHYRDADRDNSGSAGLALAMAMCRSFAENPPGRTVHILFMGAEFGRTDTYQLGTAAFLQDYFSNTPDIFLYIDLRHLPESLVFEPYGTGIVSPAWLVRHTAENLLARGIPYTFSSMDFNIHQLGFNSVRTRIDPYLSHDIPAVYIGSGASVFSGKNSGDRELSIPDLHDFLTGFIDTLPRTFPVEWDRHYLFFKWHTKTIIISELSYVLMLLFIFAAVLMYPFFQRKRFYRYLRSIRHNSWVLPIIFLLMFLYLLISTFLLEGIARFRETPGLWQQSPFLMLLLKIGFAAFLFSLSHRVTAPFHLNRLRGSFYSASGLLFLLINVVILTSYNLALTVYGGLLFFLGFLFTVVRHRLLKTLYLLISIVLILALTVQGFRTGSSSVMYGILLSHIQGNLLISFQLLPYMLFFLRLNVLFHHPNRLVKRRLTFVFELLFGSLSIILIAYFAFFHQAQPGDMDQLSFYEQIDPDRGEHTIRISSSEELGQLAFTALDETTIRVNGEFNSLKEAELSLPLPQVLLRSQVTSQRFLGRAIYTIVLDSPYPPEELNASFISSSRINLYDSDYPAAFSESRERVDFLIGRYPVFPFRMSFTLPEELVGNMVITTDYYTPPYVFDIGPGNYELDYHLENTSRIQLPPPPNADLTLQDEEDQDEEDQDEEE